MYVGGMERQDLARVAAQYWESAALNAAVQVGLFAALSEGAKDTASLIEILDVSEPHVESLLEALWAMDVVGQEEGLWRVAPSLASALDPDSADSLLPVLAFNGDLFGLWGQLPGTVRSGRPPVPDNPHLGVDADRTRRFVRGMHSRGSLYAEALAGAIDLGGVQRLLDVGGGPGTFAVALAHKNPQVSITIFDLPAVVEVAAELQESHPARQQVQFEAGSYHDDSLPGGHDALLYVGALHQETREGARALFARFFDTLPTGAPCWIVDLMLDPGRKGPAFSALFGVNMLLMRPTARMWAVDEVQALLEDVGFATEASGAIPNTPYQFVHAVKPDGNEVG